MLIHPSTSWHDTRKKERVDTFRVRTRSGSAYREDVNNLGSRVIKPATTSILRQLPFATLHVYKFAVGGNWPLAIERQMERLENFPPLPTVSSTI